MGETLKEMGADRWLAVGLLSVYALFRTIWEWGWLAGVFSAIIPPSHPWYPYLMKLFPLWPWVNGLVLVPLLWLTIVDVLVERDIDWVHSLVAILAVIYLIIAIPVWLVNGSAYLSATTQFFTTNMFVDMPGIAMAAVALVYYLVAD